MKDSNSCYITLFNISDKEIKTDIPLSRFELEKYKTSTELWSGVTQEVDKYLKATIPSHGAVIFKLI